MTSQPVESWIFCFHPPISNPLFSKMVLNKGCHTPYGYGIVFQMPKFRASHMFWSLANRGLKTIDKFTIRKAMKKQYIHTKIMIWSPKKECYKEKNGYMTWESRKVGSISSNHNLGALASFLRITSISRYHFMLLRFLAINGRQHGRSRRKTSVDIASWSWSKYI